MPPSDPQIRFEVSDLTAFAESLFRARGLSNDKARTVARHLVEADLFGRSSHGIALAPRYLADIAKGVMLTDGDPEVVADRGACLTWNGRMLPGMWLTARALDVACERVKTYGTVTVAVSSSHHIGCLATYLPIATNRGLMAIVSTTDASKGCMAPFGGTRALFTTNPVAVGVPTNGDPIMLDTSASMISNNVTQQMARAGKRAPGEWYLDPEGEPTDDPAVVAKGGTILPAGGAGAGNKGYCWAIFAEALTQALPGSGRADAIQKRGNGIFVQVIDPAAFAGTDAYLRQTDALAAACRANPPRPGFPSIRMPGDGALSKKREALRTGLPLTNSTIETLATVAAEFEIAFPPPLKG